MNDRFGDALDTLVHELAGDYPVVMAAQRLGILLLCVGALSVLIAGILAIQVAPERTGGSPYLIVFCGLILMIAGYYIGKRRA